jgi:hypothetical protein
MKKNEVIANFQWHWVLSEKSKFLYQFERIGESRYNHKWQIISTDADPGNSCGFDMNSLETML